MHADRDNCTDPPQSTLIQALFRLVEYETQPEMGADGSQSPPSLEKVKMNQLSGVGVDGSEAEGIWIDGRNIQTQLGLGCLRSRLTIIPQDPQLVPGGTVRENLDPGEFV